MKVRNRLVMSATAATLAAAFFVPTTATASPSTTTFTAASSGAMTQGQEAELAQTLESLFEEALILGPDGVVSYDQEKAASIIGEQEAADIGASLEAARAQGAGPQALQSSQARAASTGNAFVDCMVENSVIGLISGIVSGEIAELIRDKKWDEVAEKVGPKLVRAGVAGGIAGVAASLAAGAVQCSLFSD
ncbi:MULTISPECIES: hypothetical protein [unclassified Pseudoclavibacter]|uniref:hypothetical protein n=1 Tax=unclassified Pseudoclavibacter TaxID=2615177 RepID=UPI000D467134|nr:MULTISPECIES: hypothetical protein [unclassified Pseudoclavibacter]MBF4548691.1 hypothetical protein [Pseudoclavibacter sp. VKM Ac-2888]PPF75141.1 hypothetical protein C5B99_11450 [Pseudoclavibacter sp. Z016]